MNKLTGIVFGICIGLLAEAGTEIKLNSGVINTYKGSKFLVSDASESQTQWIVQFKSHIKESDKNNLIKKNILIMGYLPEDALIVRSSQAQMLSLSQEEHIQAILPMEAKMKLSNGFGTFAKATLSKYESAVVSLYNDIELEKVLAKIENLSNVSIQVAESKNLVVFASRENLLHVASFEEIEHIQEVAPVLPLHIDLQTDARDITVTAGDYTDLNGYETGTKIMNFEQAWGLGLIGQNQIVGMADTGLDTGDSKAIHRDFSGAIRSGYAVGMFGKSWADPMGHGTHVAGSVLSRGTMSGGKLTGGAYASQMVVQGMWSPILNNLSVPSNLAGMFQQAYADGARIHTNSWGAAANFGAYEKMAATVDEVMFNKEDLLILFAAGNSGVDKNRDGRIDPNSVGTPGTAKNALTVGASENYLFTGGIQRKIGELKPAPENWPVAPISESKLSDNMNGIAMFSSRGPTNDGRIKPDIVAPGTNILSNRSQDPKAEVLWGAYNQDYVYSGGTSMACPLTAAGAAVTRQFLIEKLSQSKPSAALVKAYMLHTATELFPGQYGQGGAGKGQEILTLRPNNDEGYGRVNMAEVVSLSTQASLLVFDSKEASGVATGEMETHTLQAHKSGHLQVNIVWTDAPGSANASKALVNDLDLEVTLPNGKTVSLNDQTNNHSFIQSPTDSGSIQIRVKGVNVPMGKSGKQRYALVASVK